MIYMCAQQGDRHGGLLSLSQIPLTTEVNMSNPDLSHRGLWLAIIVIGGLVVASVGGGVLLLAGATVPIALAAAGAGFVALVGLGMTGYRFLTS